MHGVRRGIRPSEAQLEQERKRSAHVANIIRKALVLRGTPLPNPLNDEFNAAYNLVETALLTNPDEYTLWSFRREVFIARLQQQQQSTELWRYELTLTSKALRNHPKAYPAWQHRIWLLEQAPSICKPYISISSAEAVTQELQLTKLMLSQDARNFHGWAHRMRVRSFSHDDDDSKELQFVTQKINDDFANYSAWHHRSVLLPRVEQQITRDVIQNELEFVKQAFYTEPDVQSVWFYHRWLLAGAPRPSDTHFVDDHHADIVDQQMLEGELESCEQLLELEPDARYAWQTKAHILVKLGKREEAFQTLDKLVQLVSFCVLSVLIVVD